MYSIVMLAAMTAAPETPEFCGLFRKCCGARQYSYCPPPYSPPCLPQPCGASPCGSSPCGASPCGASPCGAAPCGYFPVNQPNYEVLPATQGRIKIQVPADATVYTDNYLTKETGTVRLLTTPVITPGQDHHYTVKVELKVNGETRVASKQVVVRGGSVTVADFSHLGASKTTSAVTVNLPAGSKLLVDGVETQGAKFNTPELPVGQSVTHTFATESKRDGRTEIETRRVSFKAGEPVVIDFTRKSGDSVVSVK